MGIIMSDVTESEAETAPAQPVSLGRAERYEGRVVPITDPITITVDGRTVTAQKGELLIDACERAGAYIPRFCYHPRMTAVGMCRMCLVEVDGPRGPSLQPSCMVPVAPDMVANTTKDNVKKAQDGILEFLLANHPLDCPVCDKGGECPLQDQTVSYGPGESRFVEEKRHYEKPIAISDNVYLDRERCILCDRCTRFADEVAGDALIHFTERGSNTQVLTFPNEPFASYFSGNVVQICPVGALTAKPYRFKARPWDLESGESTCTDCSVGCRVTVDTSRNQLLRINGVDNDAVNQGWLCDRGRFGFEAVNSSSRLEHPMVRTANGLERANWSDALDHAASLLNGAATAGGAGAIAVVGGAELTNEGAFAWSQLAERLGTANVTASMGRDLGPEVYDLPSASIDDMCRPGGTVLWIGPDPKEELPVLFLRLRDAVLRKGVRLLHIASPEAGSLESLAHASATVRLGEIGRALHASFTGLDPLEDPPTGLDALLAQVGDDRPLTVVVGRRSLAEGVEPMLAAIGAVQRQYPSAKFLVAHPQANLRGAYDSGLSGRSIEDICAGIDDGRISAVVVLGCDPAVEALAADSVAASLAKAKLIVIESLPTSATANAEVVFPMSAWGETNGTTTNVEGRVMTLRQRVTATGTSRDDWQIAADLADRLNIDLGIDTVDDAVGLMASTIPSRAAITVGALASERGRDGIIVQPTAGAFDASAPAPLPRVSGYSLRLVAVKKLYSDSAALRACASSAHMVAAAVARLNPADFVPLGIVEGGEVTMISPSGRCVVPVMSDASVGKGSVHVAVDALGANVASLIDPNEPLTEVRIEVGGA